jgi:integrase
MGTYRRGKTKKWYVDLRDGKGRRIRKSVGTSKKVARLVEKDLAVKIAKKEFLGIFEENAIDFATYAKEWLERKKVTASKSTWRDYKSIMDVYAIPHFGKIPLCNVHRRDVELFVDKLSALSAKRKNNIMVPLKCLFNDARRRGDLKDSPCETFPRFKEEKPFIDPLSFQEMKAFLANVEKEYAAYFSTAFLTGMRPNELLALKWLAVDFDMRVITVREGRVQGVEGAPKTLSSYRDIDMLDPLYAVLLKHRQESSPDAKHVFVGKKGKPFDVHNVRNRAWYPTLAKAGLRRRTMYQTRHTFASLMLAYSEDPLWVARMLGHTSTEMLYRHYGKFIRNRMRRDGMRFLKGFQEAGVTAALPPAAAIEKPETP